MFMASSFAKLRAALPLVQKKTALQQMKRTQKLTRILLCRNAKFPDIFIVLEPLHSNALGFFLCLASNIHQSKEEKNH